MTYSFFFQKNDALYGSSSRKSQKEDQSTALGISSFPVINAASDLSVGLERKHNEDAIITFISSVHVLDLFVNFGLFVIADGMGGHASGELASNLAVQTVCNHVLGELFKASSFGRTSKDELEVSNILSEAVKIAQQAVLSEVPGSGSTLTVALIFDDNLLYEHIGDTRLYISEGGHPLKQITKDHSLVRRLVELGQITPAEAATHPQRNVLIKALGQTESFEADHGSLKLSPGLKILLCSDGLWGQVSDNVILEIINKSIHLKDACSGLITAANKAGGLDNASVILIEYS